MECDVTRPTSDNMRVTVSACRIENSEDAWICSVIRPEGLVSFDQPYNADSQQLRVMLSLDSSVRTSSGFEHPCLVARMVLLCAVETAGCRRLVTQWQFHFVHNTVPSWLQWGSAAVIECI
jgi:hypothetical protein